MECINNLSESLRVTKKQSDFQTHRVTAECVIITIVLQ